MPSAGPHVSGVILAAGSSSRMGRPKQLLPLGGEPLLRHTVRAALASNLAEVILVLGHRSEEIAAALGPLGHRTVINHRFADGQSSSLQAGVAAVDPASEALLFLLGDQPEVDAAVINAVVGAFAQSGASIVVPRYGEESGHPVLFSRELFSELEAIRGDIGAREIVARHGDSRVEVPIKSSAPPPDVDTPSAYEALAQRWSANNPDDVR